MLHACAHVVVRADWMLVPVCLFRRRLFPTGMSVLKQFFKTVKLQAGGLRAAGGWAFGGALQGGCDVD